MRALVTAENRGPLLGVWLLSLSRGLKTGMADVILLLEAHSPRCGKQAAENSRDLASCDPGAWLMVSGALLFS